MHIAQRHRPEVRAARARAGAAEQRPAIVSVPDDPMMMFELMMPERPRGMARDDTDPAAVFRPPAPTVPLGALADVRVVTGPPMIKDEDGVLVGYVFADIDLAERDLGGWVDDAKRLVEERLAMPPGYGLAWTGHTSSWRRCSSAWPGSFR